MSGSRSSSRRVPSTGMQITPLVWRIMNAIFSGVIFSAAMMRSPSFSRSASSTTITISPRATAAMAFSISVKGIVSSPWLTSSRSTYLASTSTSRLTGSPGALAPSVVTARVCGMTATSKRVVDASAATVRLMPSTVIEPFSTT